MIKEQIEKLWKGESQDFSCVMEVIKALDSGELRIAEKVNDNWYTNDYLKKAILLFFRNNKSKLMESEICSFFDKVPLKTKDWSNEDFIKSGFRVVPGGLIRYGAYIAKSVVLMPCFVNIGAFIDENTMIDSNVLIGSCAQIGKSCHISDGVTIGGVLEPLQSSPVIIEDNCFIGVRSAITEGIIVREGAVIGTGVMLSSSTKIIDRETGKIFYGEIPPYSVVVSGSYHTTNNLSLYCAVIVKKVSKDTRHKTKINELLR